MVSSDAAPARRAVPNSTAPARPGLIYGMIASISSRSFLQRPRILQVIETATIGHRADQRGQFQRSDRDAVAEAGHHADAVVRSAARQQTCLLALDIVAGLFAQAEQLRVITHALESQLLSQRREVLIVRFRQRLRQADRRAPIQMD